jgi:hypothetical protein
MGAHLCAIHITVFRGAYAYAIHITYRGRLYAFHIKPSTLLLREL